jgi:NDP-sugar pyrophosphorylase family protein
MPSPNLPAMVLTAGYGARLQPLTSVRAKPAVPVAGEALVRRILRGLQARGITDLVLNLHHKPDSIREAVGDGADLGVRVAYSHEIFLLGTAGGPRRALPLLGADRFFLVNGDTLADVDLKALALHHAESGALVTMALIPNPDPSTYGGVVVDVNGRVTGFAASGPANRWYHFVGTQVVEASVFATLPANCPLESVGGVYPRLIANRLGSVRAFICDTAFEDIGTPADYLASSLRIARREGGAARLVGPGSHTAPAAHVARTILWDDVQVGAGADLTECIVTDGVRVPSGARFRRVALVRRIDHEPGPGEEVCGEAVAARFAVRPSLEETLCHEPEGC